MTRRCDPPEGVTVLLAGGLPARLHWAGSVYHVEHVVMRWRRRVWWRGVWREYYKLAVRTPDGVTLLLVYLDLIGGGWRIQVVYD